MSPVGMGWRGGRHLCVRGHPAQPSSVELLLGRVRWLRLHGHSWQICLCQAFQRVPKRREARLGVFGVMCIVVSRPGGMVFQAGCCDAQDVVCHVCRVTGSRHRLHGGTCCPCGGAGGGVSPDMYQGRR